MKPVKSFQVNTKFLIILSPTMKAFAIIVSAFRYCVFQIPCKKELLLGQTASRVCQTNNTLSIGSDFFIMLFSIYFYARLKEFSISMLPDINKGVLNSYRNKQCH
jgi:hypothetical protein